MSRIIRYIRSGVSDYSGLARGVGRGSKERCLR
jgi:hypothetical protein